MSSTTVEPPFADKVAFLLRPENYPDRPSAVETVATHMSQVFLTDHYAFKLKKPVRYAFLDFSTVQARHRDCLDEVRLNRRLAKNIYLGVVPLTVDDAGNLRLGQPGAVVDWLVKMRRLPTDRMLDQLIRRHALDDEELCRVVAVLARFYRAAPAELLDPIAYVHQFERDIRDNYRALIRPEFDLPRQLIEEITRCQLAYLKRNPQSLYRRVIERRIIEAHGDLRPEHIFLLTHPVIIDCLEFKREFRILDAADELAFLAMECERLNSAELGGRIFAWYTQYSGDTPGQALIEFYMSYRAMLRAKLAIWHLKDALPNDHAKWRTRARAYLELANVHANTLNENFAGA